MRVLFVALLGFCIAFASSAAPIESMPPRKALVLGRADPGSHPDAARNYFLRMVGNPQNDPRKGWICDFSWDVMKRFGLDPTNTSSAELFDFIGEHRLGYRIVIACGPFGSTAPHWGKALDNGMMPFAPQGNNVSGLRVEDRLGLRSAIGVAGGNKVNVTSYGPGVEFIDALPVTIGNPSFEDAAQSWANQVVAGRFAHVLDANLHYNIWDARQHLRQAATLWQTGWNETNGYGRVNEKAIISKLLPAPPVDFSAALSRDRHFVCFTWRNFLQSNFAATVIARQDGRILYEGTGTNFTWLVDREGSETFVYWSRNRFGEKSRIESYQMRT
ncbi:MAG TPA: hypothetical protein VEC99_11655, partial [Clostridia bacterium]|nr:hypothetical protein [Clostridia bacterium]